MRTLMRPTSEKSMCVQNHLQPLPWTRGKLSTQNLQVVVQANWDSHRLSLLWPRTTPVASHGSGRSLKTNLNNNKKVAPDGMKTQGNPRMSASEILSHYFLSIFLFDFLAVFVLRISSVFHSFLMLIRTQICFFSSCASLCFSFGGIFGGDAEGILDNL